MSKLYKFEVNGKGRFPVDMLRYDSCWPSRGEDATSLLDDSRDKSRMIVMCSNHKPTEDRWRSFGWRVTGVRPFN